MAYSQPASAFQEIVSASTFGSYAVVPGNVPCDIFINHRGSDVKHNLASTIYHILDLIGLRPFLDNEALKPSSFIPAAIQHAIKSASLHIAIFSPNYAQSPWCLDELSYMIQTGTKIIPIFYYVQPSDLRWIKKGKGMYVDAFAHHQETGRYSSRKLEEWKKALHDVSFLSGHLVDNNEFQGRMLKCIVHEALKIKTGVPLWIAKHLIRMEEYMDKFEKFLDDIIDEDDTSSSEDDTNSSVDEEDDDNDVIITTTNMLTLTNAVVESTMTKEVATTMMVVAPTKERMVVSAPMEVAAKETTMMEEVATTTTMMTVPTKEMMVRPVPMEVAAEETTRMIMKMTTTMMIMMMMMMIMMIIMTIMMMTMMFKVL